ncbi:leucyl aminopeptidase [Paracoccus sp. P2]|uniref:Probable cytosol aminopeptidase n=1 Tax=Paracoccus pantotrophus TaxID=82367 RepID=A0A454NMR5_PARPN|nr:leucyl aminopeptidase [Paracoccus pantotrophus]QFG37246.1 leucyl aminopeptidase [Paracoccus pantotrophus]QLH14807.1 leucyl aminopeptidase [Paracoccus pantotrophus]RDD99756.1 leucyl aminopeptidase [Paracoccus pantotrophus]RKS52324.1 leucyl aminopeptidase [Paracoccus pantotrophus]RNI18122.1 leucyl aminopeptidase [Paracoccus pantotrophus]
MTHPVEISFTATDVAGLAERPGRIAILVPKTGRLPAGLPRATREAVGRAFASEAWKAVKPGKALELAFPAGLKAESLQIVLLPSGADVATSRAAGASIGARLGKADTLVLAGNHARAAEVALGLALRAYDFSAYKTKKSGNGAAAEGETPAEPAATTSHTGAPQDARLSDAAGTDEPASGPAQGATPRGRVIFMHQDPEALARAATDGAALAEGVFFTRDLVNEPANVLTTSDFADRLLAMRELGLEVEVLEEDELARLGMRALLAVGQGSESPSKVVVMRWNGGGDAAPLALVGKGVVFDTGGISIKPAAGMEEMTMDMGGAGVVAGVMRVLALRRAKANVVGLVGLVENMPDGRAQRPGDIVRSMKGDTIEVINTDAEGRLVLADVLWYAQQRFKPAALVDLATLTGAVIIALGHENAGVFSNDDAFATAVLNAAKAEGEGAWRLPLGPAYDKLIDSRLADIKNTGGRAAGSITAAQFLQRFVGEGMPWVHLDIAGVALPPAETGLAPKGASGWGVMTLDRLVRDRFEKQG